MRSTVILCDLDEPDQRREGIGVVRLAIDGVERNLDVCEEHLAFLRTLPSGDSAPRDPSVSGNAKPTGSSNRSGGRSPRRTPTSGRPIKAADATLHAAARTRKPDSRRARQERIAAARQWARTNGREVADRGRLPTGLLDEFEAAHS